MQEFFKAYGIEPKYTYYDCSTVTGMCENENIDCNDCGLREQKETDRQISPDKILKLEEVISNKFGQTPVYKFEQSSSKYIYCYPNILMVRISGYTRLEALCGDSGLMFELSDQLDKAEIKRIVEE